MQPGGERCGFLHGKNLSLSAISFLTVYLGQEICEMGRKLFISWLVLFRFGIGITLADFLRTGKETSFGVLCQLLTSDNIFLEVVRGETRKVNGPSETSVGSFVE